MDGHFARDGQSLRIRAARLEPSPQRRYDHRRMDAPDVRQRSAGGSDDRGPANELVERLRKLYRPARRGNADEYYRQPLRSSPRVIGEKRLGPVASRRS